MLLCAALALALIDWLAIAKKWITLGYFTRPGVILALLAWFSQVGGFNGWLAWFAVGLVFSLAGDILLKIPGERFHAGLASFLVAHLAYLIGFNATLPPLNAPFLILAILVAITGIQIYMRLAARGISRLHVLVYGCVLCLMLLSALISMVRTEWLYGPALLVSSGALMLFTSDTLLAWDRLVASLPNGKLWMRITYQMGQILLIMGVVFQSLYR
jgi:uncharacterized membrane protein YhhN